MASAGKLEARITIPTGGWSVEVSDDTRSEVTATIAAGTYYLSSADSESENLVDALATAINASNASTGDTWTVTLDAGEGGTGRVTIDTDGASFSLSWTSAALGELLGFAAAIESATTPQTGTRQAQALWLPSYGWQGKHASPSFQGRYITDMHTWTNSAGYSGGVIGQKRRETNLRWPMITDAKANAISESTTNESMESFLLHGVWAEKSWATVGGPIRFYGDLTVDSHTTWFVPDDLSSYDPQRLISEEFWDGLWTVEIPRLVLVPGSGVGTGNPVSGKISGTATGSATSSGTASGTISGGNISGTATGSATSSGTASGTVSGGGPTQLLDLNFTAPLTSWTTGRTGFSSAFATDEWILSGPTAGAYANNVGSATLNNTGGLEDQVGRGIYDGTNYYVDAWEADAATDYAECSSNTVLDSDSDDFTVRCVFRKFGTPSGNAYFVGKRNGANAGWSVRFTITGQVECQFEDGTGTQVTGPKAVSNHCDGAWHYFEFRYEHGGSAYIKTDLDSEVSTSVASLGSLTNTQALRIGAQLVYSGTAGVQIAYVGGVVETGGGEALSMYNETFWQHGQDPTGLLDTIDRNCLISIPLGSWDAVGHFAPDQLPIGDDGTFTAGYGLYCNSAVTNLVTYSRLSTGATNSNVSATDNNSDAADGFRAATTLTASADNGYQAKTVTTLASTAYVGSVYIRQNTAGVTGRVILYDESNAAELGSTAFTGTASWQRVQVAASTVGGGVSTSLRVEIDTNGESVDVDFWQVELGSQAGAIINTNGATASLVYSDYGLNGSAGEYTVSATGEAEIICNITKQSDGNEWWWSASNGSAQAGSRGLRQGTDLDHDFLIYNSSGGGSGLAVSLATAPRSVGTEYAVITRWDSSGNLDVGGGTTAQMLVNGTSVDTSTAAFTTDEDLTHVRLGERTPSSVECVNGFVQRLRIWDAEGGA